MKRNFMTQGHIQGIPTHRLVAICLVVQHSGPLGTVAAGLHGPQPHLVLWEPLQNTQVIKMSNPSTGFVTSSDAGIKVEQNCPIFHVGILYTEVHSHN